MAGKAIRPGRYTCCSCREQSRVTVGTVFESSYVRLNMFMLVGGLIEENESFKGKNGRLYRQAHAKRHVLYATHLRRR